MTSRGPEYKILLLGSPGVGKQSYATCVSGSLPYETSLRPSLQASAVSSASNVKQHWWQNPWTESPATITTTSGNFSFRLWVNKPSLKTLSWVDQQRYYEDAHAAILCLDCTSRITSESVSELYLRVDTISKVLPRIPVALCVFKVDVEEAVVQLNPSLLLRRLGIPVYFVSTKGRYNVEKPLLYIAKRLSRITDLRITQLFGVGAAEIQMSPRLREYLDEKMQRFNLRGAAGYVSQPRDDQDKIYAPSAPLRRTRPMEVDLRIIGCIQSAPYDQGWLHSCTANAIASAIQFGRNAAQTTKVAGHLDPARLFIYWYQRITDSETQFTAMELEKYLYKVAELGSKGKDGQFDASDTVEGIDKHGTHRSVPMSEVYRRLQEDHGGNIRDGIRCLRRLGVCREQTWPYSLPLEQDKQAFLTSTAYIMPPVGALREGRRAFNQDFLYRRILDLGDDINTDLVGHMESALMEGYPIIMAMWFPKDVTKTFNHTNLTSDSTYMHLADSSGEYCGHTVLVVGYERYPFGIEGRFLCLQSGGRWCDNNDGYFYLPYYRFQKITGKFEDYLFGGLRAQVTDLWVISMDQI